nr:MAG TPA: hypothetical protein [Caudoviricetes sp.]
MYGFCTKLVRTQFSNYQHNINKILENCTQARFSGTFFQKGCVIT